MDVTLGALHDEKARGRHSLRLLLASWTQKIIGKLSGLEESVMQVGVLLYRPAASRPQAGSWANLGPARRGSGGGGGGGGGGAQWLGDDFRK